MSTVLVSDVVSFRPSPEERALIERARRRLGTKSRAQAVRYLIRRSSELEVPFSRRPMFRHHLPKRFRTGRGTTSREIDDELYGGRP